MYKSARAFRSVIAILWLVLAPHAIGQMHPLFGKWTWTRPENNCTEVYQFRADGTFDVVSGEEVTSGKYEISFTADANGFFMMKGQTLKTNGARDCSDPGSPPGDFDKPYTVYFIFHRTQPMHLQCYEPSLEKCFGPLRLVTE
jgi:hypothetical protein